MAAKSATIKMTYPAWVEVAFPTTSDQAMLCRRGYTWPRDLEDGTAIVIHSLVCCCDRPPRQALPGELDVVGKLGATAEKGSKMVAPDPTMPKMWVVTSNLTLLGGGTFEGGRSHLPVREDLPVTLAAIRSSVTAWWRAGCPAKGTSFVMPLPEYDAVYAAESRQQ